MLSRLLKRCSGADAEFVRKLDAARTAPDDTSFRQEMALAKSFALLVEAPRRRDGPQRSRKPSHEADQAEEASTQAGADHA